MIFDCQVGIRVEHVYLCHIKNFTSAMMLHGLVYFVYE